MAEIFLCLNYFSGIMQSRNGNIAYMSKLLVFRGGEGLSGKERTKKILNNLLRHLAMEKYDCVRVPFILMASDLDFTLGETEEIQSIFLQPMVSK